MGSRDKGGKQEGRERWRGKVGRHKVTGYSLVTDGSVPSEERQDFTDLCLPSP